MSNKTLKVTAIAAGAVLLAGTAFAAPSFAHSKNSSVKTAASSSTSAPTWTAKSGDAQDGFKRGLPADRVESKVAATITGVPTTVTDLEVAEHSALFMAYEFTGTAPTAQPTTGGHPARFEATALANGTVTGTLGFLSPKTAGTYKVAVYTSSADATADLVTIVVDSAGVATATAATPLTAAYDANAKAPAFGKGPKGHKGEKGKDGRGHGPKGGENAGSGWTPPATGTTPAPTAPTV